MIGILNINVDFTGFSWMSFTCSLIIDMIYIIHKLNKEVRSFKTLFLMTVILSVLGEYVSLYTRKGSVFDYWDILCYFIGLAAYYIMKNHQKMFRYLT